MRSTWNSIYAYECRHCLAEGEARELDDAASAIAAARWARQSAPRRAGHGKEAGRILEACPKHARGGICGEHSRRRRQTSANLGQSLGDLWSKPERCCGVHPRSYHELLLAELVGCGALRGDAERRRARQGGRKHGHARRALQPVPQRRVRLVRLRLRGRTEMRACSAPEGRR